ncbi:NAD(P)H-binding protein [Acinetobacter seifertii]|nr:NAD(P)H-binding protein [Acinetobacter seifertii]
MYFIGYGKTSQRVAKQLFETGHQITTISRSEKTDPYGTHLIQDIFTLDLSEIAPVDVVYILLSPDDSTVQGYHHTYVDSIEPIRQALKSHPVKRLIVVSSTRVYGENSGEKIDDDSQIHRMMLKAIFFIIWNAMAEILSSSMCDCTSHRNLWCFG